MNDKNDTPNIISKSTSPSINKKIRNPFDKALIDKLQKPLCSPGMCKIYKKRGNGSFGWEIDQACVLVPADIVACNSQFEPSPDPALEKIAEEATERFFSQEIVIPSPLESSKKAKPLLALSDTSVQSSYFKEQTVEMRDVSAQTILTLPPELPPEIENLLLPFCTFTQDQNISGDYEITANGSLRRKLFFQEHSYMDHYDSEQTDDEIHIEQRPPSSSERHTPIVFSPDLSQDLVTKGMKRTFDTPLKKSSSTSNKPCYRNKVLDVVDFGESCFSPIEFCTPQRAQQRSATSSSLASSSISPVTKAVSSDEKNNFTSPESDLMATCPCDEKGPCFCKTTPNKSNVKRSTSLKESPGEIPRSRKNSQSFSERRSLSLSNLYRSKSVQKLDFSMNMSIDGSFHDNSQDVSTTERSTQDSQATWSIVEETSIQHTVKVDSYKDKSQNIQSSTIIHSVNANMIEETPIKGKCKSTILGHEISKIRAPMMLSPNNMSLDSSLDDPDNRLSLEDKNIDFNKVDLKFLTDNVSSYDYSTNNVTKTGENCSTSFKRVDSGFNENTFYTNASSYYESAIKPSELTVTHISGNNKTVLKEITNVNWMRVDSGFKDEHSSDGVQFYNNVDSDKKIDLQLSGAKLENKENILTEDFDTFLVHAPNKAETMLMSDTFTDDMTFNCNFSSTPSKNKTRRVNT